MIRMSFIVIYTTFAMVSSSVLRGPLGVVLADALVVLPAPWTLR